MNKADVSTSIGNNDSFGDEESGSGGTIAILLVVLFMFLGMLGFGAYIITNQKLNKKVSDVHHMTGNGAPT